MRVVMSMKIERIPRRPLALPFSVRIEPRMEKPRWLSFVISLGAIIAGLIIGGLVLTVVGGNPFRTYAFVFDASLGNIGVLSDTLTKATPLILTSLAAIIAFRMRLWNIGAEGQLYMGAFGASAVVLIPLLPEDSSPWLFIPAMILAGALMGALWGFIPGLLKAKFNVNEIITSLMLNYIAEAWNNYFIFAVWSERGFQMSKLFPRNSWFPRLLDFSGSVPAFRGLTTHLGLLLGLLMVGVLWWILFRSRWGYEIRLTGDNPRAGRFAGVNIARNTILVMSISGALAGLAGVSEISGVVHRFQGGLSANFGFSGIIIAWLAKLNPILAVPFSIFFGALILGTREIQPSGIAILIQGIILICLIASDFVQRYQIHLVPAPQEA
jgi:ABC-type uncharacterized transport system permease subunit